MQGIQKTRLVLQPTYTGDTPCQILFYLDNSMSQSNILFFKINYLNLSEIFIWKLNFFHRLALPNNLSSLDSTYTGDTPCQEKFDLGFFLSPCEGIFVKFVFRNVGNFLYED